MLSALGGSGINASGSLFGHGGDPFQNVFIPGRNGSCSGSMSSSLPTAAPPTIIDISGLLSTVASLYGVFVTAPPADSSIDNVKLRALRAAAEAATNQLAVARSAIDNVLSQSVRPSQSGSGDPLGSVLNLLV